MSTKRLAELAASIDRDHKAAEVALSEGVAHAVTVGRHLLEARALMPHGGWLSWLKDNSEVGERSAQGYMRLAKAPRVADMPLRDALAELGKPRKPENYATAFRRS